MPNDIYDEAKEWLAKRAHRTINAKHTDFLFLYKFLQRHPSYDTWKFKEAIVFKISRNTQKSLVMYVKFKGTKKFRIVSWVACARAKLSSRQTSDTNQLTSAMRYATRTQLRQYRRTHSPEICVLCQKRTQIEVDHHPLHFSTIRDNFLAMKEKRGDPPPTDFTYHPKKGRFIFKNGTKKDNYYDKRWKQAWQRYHNKHASYRFLCSICNRTTNQQK